MKRSLKEVIMLWSVSDEGASQHAAATNPKKDVNPPAPEINTSPRSPLARKSENFIEASSEQMYS